MKKRLISLLGVTMLGSSVLVALGGGAAVAATATPKAVAVTAVPLSIGKVRRVTVPGVIGVVTERWVAGNSPELTHVPGLRYASEVLVRTGGTLKAVQRSTFGVAAVHPALVTPLDASGCAPGGNAYATCIDIASVGGSGPDIYYWETDGYMPNADNVCEPEYIVNGTVEEQDFFVCDGGPGRYEDDTPSIIPQTFANNTQLCNYWPGALGGEPCETVKS